MYEVADSVSFVTTISSSIFRMCLNFYYFCAAKPQPYLSEQGKVVRIIGMP